MSMSAELKESAFHIGLDDLRITAARASSGTAGEILARQARGLIPATYGWSEEEIHNSCNPGYFLPGARSVIVAALCYLTDEEEDQSSPGDPHGLIAPYTRRNYYKETRKKLEKLTGLIKKRFPSARSYISSCGAFREKPFAARSGIGYYGSHGIIITRHWGSWVVLGSIITDVAIPEDEPLDAECGKCLQCMKDCPTGAIIAPKVIDMEKCLQYVSIRSTMPGEFRDLWGNRLYGCVTCQKVCPINKGVKPVNRFSPHGVIGPSISLIPLLSMKDEEFRTRFAGNQLGARWISPDAIRKNALIALGNSGDPAAMTALEQALSESSDNLKEHAAWALKKIGTAPARSILERAMKKVENFELAQKIAGYLE